MNIKESFLTTVWNFLDYVPVVSTGKGIVQLVKQLFQKIVGKDTEKSTSLPIDHKWSILNKKGSVARNMTICIPVIGNIFIGIVDIIALNSVQEPIRLTPTEIAKLKAAAVSVNGEAAFELARQCDLNKEPEEQVFWLKRSAELGNSLAMVLLGNCYWNGRGVPKDFAEAVKRYEEAAKKENGLGMDLLGRCYLNGIVKPQDDKQAVFWFESGAKVGEIAAMNDLGECYRDGRGVPKDVTKAAKLFKEAAEKGSPIAKNNLDRIEEESHPSKET
jgi:hypothetical protein